MTAAIRILERILGMTAVVFHASANICLTLMIIFNMSNIVSRAVFDKGIMWVFPWTVVLFVWMVFFGFFSVYWNKKDITVDFIISKFGRKGDLYYNILNFIAVTFLMSLMLFQAPEIISSQIGHIEMVGLQRYWESVPLFLSCFLILLTGILDILRFFTGHNENS